LGPSFGALGGTDLGSLCVTTAGLRRDAGELAHLPQSGGIFAMRVEIPGLPETRFRG
jgi:sugar lactone lactonase YvrE